MAFSTGGSSSHDDDLPPPSYEGPSNPPAPPSSSGATEPLFEHPFDGTGSSSGRSDAGFSPEALADLNPEVSKKLAREARESGHDVGDYGFDRAPGGAGEMLPTFGEAEVRPVYNLDGAGNIVRYAFWSFRRANDLTADHASILSHDAALNSSPVALLRFLRLHASSPPTLSIHIRGTHTEKRTETTFENHKYPSP